MSNETKERFPLRMKPETSRRLEQWYAADNCRSKNEFVEKAINFYVDYLETQDNQSLLPTALQAALEAGWVGWRTTSPGGSLPERWSWIFSSGSSRMRWRLIGMS